MSEPKYKVGEKARVVGKKGLHYFKINDEVIIDGDMELDPDDNSPYYRCKKKEEWQLILESDLSPIEEQTNLVAEGQSLDGDSVAALHSGSSNSVERFKEGQELKIIANTSDHHFEIGEIITVTHINEDDYRCKGNSGSWWVTHAEMSNIDMNPQEGDASKDHSCTFRPDNNSEKTMTSKDHSGLKESESHSANLRSEIKILLDCLEEAPVDFVGTGDNSKAAEAEESRWYKRWHTAKENLNKWLEEIEPKEQVSNTDWKEEFKTKIKKEGLDIAVAWVSNDIVFPAYHIADYQEGQLKDLKSENERLRNLLAEAEQK